VNGSEELPLVSANLGRVDASVAGYQPSVLIDEPRLPKHVGGGILHLSTQSKGCIARARNVNSQTAFGVKVWHRLADL